MSPLQSPTRAPGGVKPRRDPTGWARIAVLAAAAIIAGHGFVHLMGVSLLWKLGELGRLRYADAAPAPGTTAGYLVGGLWLVAAVLFVITAALLVARRPSWRVLAIAAVAVSVPVIALSPAQAAAGLVVDGLVLILAIASWLRSRSQAS
jgi:hypothetical protein